VEAAKALPETLDNSSWLMKRCWEIVGISDKAQAEAIGDW